MIVYDYISSTSRYDTKIYTISHFNVNEEIALT